MSDRKLFVLFTYGGGIRGLVAARLMQEIEEKTGLAMTDMFDVFMGPSTGAILNAALNVPHPHNPGRPKFRARHMVRFYERQGIKIFTSDKFRTFRSFIHDFNNRTMKISQLNWLLKHGHYDPSNLNRALRNLYGKTRLGETLKSLIVPTYNIDGGQIALAEERDETGDTPVRTKNNFVDGGGHAVWLKNLHFDGIQRSPVLWDVPLIDAVRASTAAPTYFPSHYFSLLHEDGQTTRTCTGIDGSIFDNPCISYLGALGPYVPKDTEVVMVILGTGYTHRSFKHEDWNRYGGLGVVDPVNDLPLINIFFHASESALFEAFDAEVGNNVYPFNRSMFSNISPKDAPSEQIDDASAENITRLHKFAELIMEENGGKLENVCNMAVKHYESQFTSRMIKKSKRLFSFFGNGKRKKDPL